MEDITCTSDRTPAHAIKENEWRDRVTAALTKNGYGDVETEKPVQNGRCDLYFAYHAVEIDWSYKWAEGIGQALLYANLLKCRAVVLLLVEGGAADKHLENARIVARYNIPALMVWSLNTKTRVLDCGHGRTIQVE